MTNEQIISKLNEIEEDLGFLEEVTNRSVVENKIEELRLIRYELERRLNYDKVTTFEDDQTGC